MACVKSSMINGLSRVLEIGSKDACKDLWYVEDLLNLFLTYKYLWYEEDLLLNLFRPTRISGVWKISLDLNLF